MRRRRVILFLVLLSLPVALAACGGGQYRELLSRTEQMQSELAQIKASNANTMVMMEDIQNKLLLLEDQVETNRTLIGRASAAQPQLPVVRLRPEHNGGGTIRIEESDPNSEHDGPGSFTMEEVPAVKFQKLEEGMTVGRTEEVKTPRTTKRRFDSRPIELYKQAYEYVREHQHAEAIEAFEAFLDQYPDHDYADNAMYWMGEAYYDSQNYEKALSCFEKVIQLYPDGNKVPDAMLKRALCLFNQGHKEGAVGAIGQLVARYPTTRAAGIAKEKLKTMR